MFWATLGDWTGCFGRCELASMGALKVVAGVLKVLTAVSMEYELSDDAGGWKWTRLKR